MLGCIVACNKPQNQGSALPSRPAPKLASSLPIAPAPAASLAHLLSASGDVRLQPAGGATSGASIVGAEYVAGDVVITGPDGSATVRFAGNNDVTLAANSTLLVRAQKGAQASLGAIVMRGSVKASSGGHGARLQIGTPVGMAEIGGPQLAVLDVSFDKGLNVEVGDVAVLGANQAPQKKLSQGQSLSIQGFAIAQQTASIDGLNIVHQATSIDGLSIGQQATTIEGLRLEQQTTSVDGLVVPKQATTVAGLEIARQQLDVDGLTIPGEAAATPALPQLVASEPSESAAKPAPTPEVQPVTEPLAGLEPVAEPEPPAGQTPLERRSGAFVTVTALPRAAQAQISPRGAMRPIMQRVKVFAGGQVRVEPQGHARVRMGGEAQLNLSAGAHFTLERTAPDGSLANYHIDSGQAQLLLKQQGDRRPEHVVRLGQTATAFTPGARITSADLSSESGEGHVYLRYGQARVDGVTIEAGQIFSVANGKLLNAPAPIVAPIAVEPAQTVEVYTRARAVPVSFAASGAPVGQKLFVELARDRAFAHILAAEQVSRPSFGLDTLPGSHVFYRLNKDPKSVGSIRVIAESEDSCPECRHADIVQDTGQKTVVYYQETLPAIDLLWDTVPNAVRYHVKVFRDGAFEHAEVDELLTQTKKSLPRGKLAEGHYYWLVTARNRANRDINEPKTNVLEITYDNVIEKMSIRSPVADAKIDADSVQTGGYVVLGQTLRINGIQAELSAQGRFDETVALRPGANTIVYKTVASDGVQRYYTREVSRLKP